MKTQGRPHEAEEAEQAGYNRALSDAMEALRSRCRINPNLPAAARTEFMQAFENGILCAIDVLTNMLPVSDAEVIDQGRQLGDLIYRAHLDSLREENSP